MSADQVSGAMILVVTVSECGLVGYNFRTKNGPTGPDQYIRYRGCAVDQKAATHTLALCIDLSALAWLSLCLV